MSNGGKLTPDPTWSIIAMGLLVSRVVEGVTPGNPESLQRLVEATEKVHAALYPRPNPNPSPVTSGGGLRPASANVGAMWIERFL